MHKKIGILMGGYSCERDISLKSGEAVLNALKSKGFNVEGINLPYKENVENYKTLAKDIISSSGIDIAFITLHGEFGEDGGLQEVLEELKIPYTGSKINASILGMDKIKSKNIFKANNIPIAEHKIIKKSESYNKEEIFKNLGKLTVVKPNNKGSSIGLFFSEISNFDESLKKAFKYSDSVIIEEYIEGREITVGILDEKTLPVIEIHPKKRFFDFEAKYTKGLTEYKLFSSPEEGINEECQRIAVLAHNSLGAKFFSRVDMIVSRNNIPIVLEVNTVPGLTETSLLPKGAEAIGIDFKTLIMKILESALWQK